MTVQPVRSFRQALAPHRDVMATMELMRIMRRGDYDVIHTHNSKAGFIGRLAAHLLGHPAIVHTIHGFFFQERTPSWQRGVFTALERRAAHWTHAAISISRVLAEWTKEVGVEYRCPMWTIYSGIEFEEFLRPIDRRAIRHCLGIDQSRLTIGIVSKLWEGKGHADLLRAFAILHERGHNPQLLIAGDGPLRPDLERLARDLGIAAHVTFTGLRQDIPEVTDAVDIATLPSYFEGMGRVLLEAMARAKPIVATTVGGIPEIVLDESTGILVPPGQPAQLATALERLIGDEPLRA